MNETVALIFAALGILAALVFGARARSARARLEGAWGENEKLAADLKSTRDQLGKQSGKLAGHADEVAELRRRLEKARRRAGGAGGQGGEAAPAALLERETDLESARQERDAARSEANNLVAEVSRLGAELAAKNAEEPPGEDPRIEALGQACAAAKKELEASREATEDLRKAKARLAKKVQTQELLYVSLRTELEAKKDRLRGQQELIERLQALEVAVGGGAGDQPASPSASAPAEAPDSD